MFVTATARPAADTEADQPGPSPGRLWRGLHRRRVRLPASPGMMRCRPGSPQQKENAEIVCFGAFDARAAMQTGDNAVNLAAAGATFNWRPGTSPAWTRPRCPCPDAPATDGLQSRQQYLTQPGRRAHGLGEQDWCLRASRTRGPAHAAFGHLAHDVADPITAPPLFQQRAARCGVVLVTFVGVPWDPIGSPNAVLGHGPR